jgi:hypothetical protein
MTAVSYFYGTREHREFSGLCESFTGRALRSPYRSTVPLLSLVHHHPAQWQSLLTTLGISDVTRLHFEFAVPSAKPGPILRKRTRCFFPQNWSAVSKPNGQNRVTVR